MSANDVKFVGNDEDGTIGAGWHDGSVRVIARGDDGVRTEVWITPQEAFTFSAHLIECARYADYKEDV